MNRMKITGFPGDPSALGLHASCISYQAQDISVRTWAVSLFDFLVSDPQPCKLGLGTHEFKSGHPSLIPLP